MTKPAIGEAEKIIEELMQLHPKGFDLSLDRISRLLEKLGNPQNRMPPVIHVAGTNGKGSVTAFCRALLEAAGLSVHVHTSPHLVNWHERYRIGVAGDKGRYVKDEIFADALRRIETTVHFLMAPVDHRQIEAEHAAHCGYVRAFCGTARRCRDR